MSDHTGTSRFRVLFEAAVQQYEKQTEITLATHPLAEQLQNCDSVDSVIAVLQEQARAFSEFRESDRIMKSLEGVVSVLSTISAVADLSNSIGLSFQPTKAIHAGIAILLSAVKGVNASYEALVDLLESIEHFLKRLNIYSEVTPTPTMTEIVVKILVEVLSTLALATKQIQQGRLKKFAKKLFGEKDAEVVLERLDRLTHEEAQMTAAQTLKVVYGLVENMKVVMDDGKASADHIRDALDIMQQIANDMGKSRRDKLQQDVRNWLNPPDPWTNHNIACESHHTGTAEWFIQGDAFSEWQSSGPSSILWIHGKPGAGKSVLCSTIIKEIDAMRKSGLVSLAFFYCDFREDTKKDQRGLLSSVLVQLCHQCDAYCDILSNLYMQHDKGSRQPSDSSLAQCLKDMTKLPGQAPVYLIVDALDECPNPHALPSSPRKKVLLLVEQLAESKSPNLRICVSSRPETDIKAVLETLTSHSISLHDESGQMEDINNYIKSVVNSSMKRLKAEDKQLIVDVLTENANGMFQWVYCQVAYLCECLPGRIRQALAELPETLDQTYERTLREIKKVNWDFAHRLLQCVAVAVRPLLVEELADFLAFDFEARPIPRFHEDWRLEDPTEAVMSTCPSLLVLVDATNEDISRPHYLRGPSSKVIQFSHYSVKEYLTSARLADASDNISRRFHIPITSAHILAARACLGILLHLDQNVTKDSLKTLPLAEYAAQNWFAHVRVEGVSQNVSDSMKLLFDPGKPHLAIWVWIHDPVDHQWSLFRGEAPSPMKRTALHYASLCGLLTIVKFLVVEHSQGVNARDFSRGLTSLHLASREGHMEIARFLVESGADARAQDSNWTTPLHLASKRGHLEVARFLIERDADARALDNYWITPLHLASRHGHLEVVRFLVESGADARAEDNDGRTPLSLAYSWEVASFFIEHGVGVTAQDNHGSTPLHLASEMGRMGVVRILVDRGANATAKDNDGLTPLHLALYQERMEIVRFILDHGADVTARDKEGLTPLHHAFGSRIINFKPITSLSWERVDVIRCLVERGADAAAQDNNGLTPLHLASSWGHMELACLLVEHGADVTAQSKHGLTPLHLALKHKYVEVARFLVEHGADATARHNNGLTPLHLTSFLGDTELVQLILSHGADVTARDKEGLTPLHLALGLEPGTIGNRTSVPRIHLKVAQLLVERGADISASDDNGCTPLHLASEEGHVEAARFLVEHGANVTAQANDGSTPLHRASQPRSVELAHLLIEHGADVTDRNNQGLTPLHLASSWNILELVRSILDLGADPAAQSKRGLTPLHFVHSFEVACILVEHGADASAQDNDGSTPLHWVARWGTVGVAQFLVERGADVTARDKEGLTPLHLALGLELARYRNSEMGKINVEVTFFLIQHGADVSTQAGNGLTPLHVASLKGYVGAVRLLVVCGADTTAQDDDGRTPLHLASQMGNFEVIRFLVECGTDVSTKDNRGQTPLHLVSENGHVEAASFLLEHGADVTAQDNDGQTPLHCASERNNVGVAHFLVERGADATAQDNIGLTPFHLAFGDVRTIRFFVENGVDATAQDTDWRNLLYLASERGSVEVIRYLVECSVAVTAQIKGWAPLHLAAQEGHLQVTRYLLEQGAHARSQDEDGTTALHLASRGGHLKVARLLLEQGAHARAQDEDGTTALHLASRGGHLKVARLLLLHGADVTAQSKAGRTPLDLASEAGHVEITRFLLEPSTYATAESERSYPLADDLCPLWPDPKQAESIPSDMEGDISL